MTSYVTNTISYDKYETPIKHYAHCGWQPDSDTSICNVCQTKIKPTLIFKSNKHHCRFCGKIICSSCSQNRSNKHRICDLCLRKKSELKNSIIKISPSLPREFVIRIPKPIKINNSKFLFVAYDNTMYYYDTIKNKWSADHRNQYTYDQQDKFPAMEPNTIAFNTQTNEIFGVSCSKNQQKLIKINLFNNNVRIIDLSSVLNNLYVYKLEDASGMFINNQYHIIGGKKSNKHYILDHKTNILTSQWTFNDFGNILKDPGLIYLESKQTLYAFGGAIGLYNNGCGWDSTRECRSDWIYKCVPSTNQKLMWKRLKVRMPSEASNFGIVSCKHDKYILLFIRENGMYTCRPGICIFDVEKERFTKSLVQCPVFDKIQIFVPSDFSYKISMLLSGYFHLNKIRTCEYFPQDIINLVMMFGGFDSDFVHILSYAEHWKLNIDYILNNTEEIKDKRSLKYGSNLWSRLASI